MLAALMAVNLTELCGVAYAALVHDNPPVVGADLVSPVVKFCTAGLSLALARGAVSAGRVSSAAQFTAWAAAAVCWGFTFGSVVAGGAAVGPDWSGFQSAVLVLQFLLAAAILVFFCIADVPSDYMDIKGAH